MTHFSEVLENKVFWNDSGKYERERIANGSRVKPDNLFIVIIYA